MLVYHLTGAFVCVIPYPNALFYVPHFREIIMLSDSFRVDFLHKGLEVYQPSLVVDFHINLVVKAKFTAIRTSYNGSFVLG